MMSEFKTLLQLQRRFYNERVCFDYLEEKRWSGKPECPHCGSQHHYRTKTRLKDRGLEGYQDFYCKACRKKYTTLTGTIFESSRIPLQTWFFAIYIATAHKKGISSLQLSRDVGVTQKTAWFILHRIRTMLGTNAAELLTGDVELDETYVGGKEINKHGKFRKKTRNPDGPKRVSNKAPVLGALQRNGEIRYLQVEKVKASNMREFVLANVAQGTRLFTDEYLGYKPLHSLYAIDSVAHGRGEYVRGHVHINTIEGAFSLLKRGIIGIYHYVSPKHLQKYCHEFKYRFNTRKETDAERFNKVLERVGNARLKYHDLIGKA